MEQIVLNPDYFFVDDLDRVALRSKATQGSHSDSNWISYLHPFQALILSEFYYPISLSKGSESLAKKFRFTKDVLVNLLASYIENPTPIYTLYNGEKILFPKNVLLKEKQLSNIQKKKLKQRNDFICPNYNKVNLTYDRMHRAPRTLLFMITSKCKTKCSYCYADKRTKLNELTTNEIITLISDAKRLDVDYIDLIGGEVFCKKDWNIILGELVNQQMSPSFLSTKVPLSDKEIKLLQGTKYSNVIQFSIDSTNNRTLNKVICSSDGYFENISYTIRELTNLGYPIQINTVLTKYNSTKEEIQRLAQFVQKVDNLILWEIRVPEVSLYEKESFNDIKPSFRQIENIVNYIREEIIPKFDGKIYVSDEALNPKLNSYVTSCEYYPGGICGILEERCFILPDGKVSVCEQMYWHDDFIIGDLRKNTLEEIWQSDKAWNMFNRSGYFGRRHKICTNCNDSNECLSTHRKCWLKSMKAYGRDHWHYPDPRCINSPKIKENTLSYE